MIVHYYNEWDKGAAAWLRELINNKLIPYGYVDERSITEVTPSDLEGFTQCHFFAGIGGWPLALQLAGIPESTRLWTGSPPCQPFSVAGKSLGFDDDRHLAPAFLRLIRECKPELLFGEQVAAAIGKHWLDFVFLNLEDKGYACGASVLPACSVGSPQERKRIIFGARMGDTNGARMEGLRESQQVILQKGRKIQERYSLSPDVASCLWDSWKPNHGADKETRVIPGGFCEATHGVSARVGRLRGYGNAIVPQVAAEFIKAFMRSV